MKIITFISLILILLVFKPIPKVFAQTFTTHDSQFDFMEYGHDNISAELYVQSNNNVLATGLFTMQFYDDVVDPNVNGFIASLIFHNTEFPSFEKDTTLVSKRDSGIVKFNFYDTKLYSYVKVVEIDRTVIGLIVKVVGIKNVPQRKKILFRDSSRLRMWDKAQWLDRKY